MHIQRDAFSESLRLFKGKRTPQLISTRNCCGVVDKINTEIEYGEFFQKYLLSNRPCILGKWATKNWLSVKYWVEHFPPDSSGTPNFEYLEKEFGTAKVPVADCRQKFYNSQHKETWIFKDFLSYWQNLIEGDCAGREKCLYLKDWHFGREFTDYEAYTTPIYFQSDWLNEFWDGKAKCKKGDDYRFVYMGPKGSWTPFHADVYRSHSWSANICGRKKWILYQPGKEEDLKDLQGNLPYDVTLSSPDDPKVFPNAHSKVEPLIIVQEEGEVIFVPSGWHHQVHNLEDTISINHNWLNAGNIETMFDFLVAEIRLVKDEIQDCRQLMTECEWLNQCQVIMKANSGIDYEEFLNLLKTIATPRINFLHSVHNGANPNLLCFESGDRRSNSRQLRKEISDFLWDMTLIKEKESADTGYMVVKTKINQFCYFHVVFDMCVMLRVLEKFARNFDVEASESMHHGALELLQTIYNAIMKTP